MSTVSNDMTCWQQTQAFASTAATTLQDGASEAKTWILTNGSVAVTKMKEVWFVIQDGGITVANKIKDFIKNVGKALWQGGVKIYETAFPYCVAAYDSARKYAIHAYTTAKDFYRAHPNETAVGIIAFAAGAFTFAVFQQFCCR